jgi:hypothetical protein
MRNEQGTNPDGTLAIVESAMNMSIPSRNNIETTIEMDK